MRSYRSSSPSISKRFFIGLSILIFFLLLQFLFSSSLTSLSYTIATPFWKVRDAIFGNTQNIPGYSQSKSSLIAEIKSLQSDSYSLQAKNLELSAQLSALSSDSAKFFPGTKENRIVVKVVSKPPYTPFDSFILGQGKANLINLGSRVYIGENILIGTISQSENSFSKVTLFSSGSNSTSVNVLRTGTGIQLKGQGSGNFLTVLPKDFDIAIGDFLVDTGAQQSVIAQVYSIDSSGEGSFKKVYSRIPYNILNSDYVLISPNITP